MTVYTEREGWLNKVAALLLPEFRKVTELKAYPKFRVSCGFPSTGKRGRRIGECWAPDNSADAVHEVFIHPGQDDPLQVAAILTHELAHVVAGIPAKHGPDFKRIIKPLGLEGRACATVPGDGFKTMIAPLLVKAGAYPHGALVTGGISTAGPKQSTRMIKVTCTGCGYVVRTTRKWLELGVTTCPCEGCEAFGETMEVA